MLRVGIVVGEASGDELGSGIINSLKHYYPNLEVEGILGPRLLEAGGYSHYPMSKLSIMGITEVFSVYLELASIRNRLKHSFLKNPPDIFIGVDAPDFNLRLEEDLRNAGIKTVHYVSPSVWAWRKGRIKQVERSADLLLTLFPFESKFYEKSGVNIECVGHPLADAIPLYQDAAEARYKLKIPSNKPVIALMPGSRHRELMRLAKPFLQAANICCKQNPDLLFISNQINQEMKESLQKEVNKYAPNIPIQITTGCPHDTLLASDVALLSSGTITLEAMLLKKPMVISYILSPITYYVVRSLISSKWAGLPNILAQETLVPEFYQSDVCAEKLATALLSWLDNPDARNTLIDRFTHIHETMKRDANNRAADAVINLYQS